MTSIEQTIKQIVAGQYSSKHEEIENSDTLDGKTITGIGYEPSKWEAICRVEEEFEIVIPEKTAEQIFTVGDLIKFVENFDLKELYHP